jgi:hypothetical protein
MRLGNALFLLRQHWRFHWGTWAIVALLVAVSAFVITLIGAAAAAVNSSLHDWSRQTFPPTVLTVRPQTQDVGLFGFRMAVPQAHLTQQVLDQIAAMPETRHLYPVIVLTFPTSASASFLGNEFSTDAVVAGIDAGLVAGEIASGESFAPVDWLEQGEKVPVLLSSYFLDLYNLMYSQTIGAPALSERTVIGFEFDLILGESVLGGRLATAHERTVRCRIVGLTRNPQLLGVTIPRQNAEQMQRWYAAMNGLPPEVNCSYAFLEVHDTSQVAAIARRLAEMNLVADTPTYMEERVATLSRLLTISSAALRLIILAITLFGCACLMVLQMAHRRPSLVFLHVSGVPGPTIFGLMVGEAGGVALAAAAVGAWGGGALLRWTLTRLALVLPISFPVPHLSALHALAIGALSAITLGGATVLVAVGVVVLMHRRVGKRPVG